MAKSNGTWVQPVSYFATVDKEGNGKFVRIPDMPELVTVAEAHGPEAADRLVEMVNRAYNAGFKEAGNQRTNLFDKHFAAHPSVRQFMRDAAKAKGIDNPSDEALTNSILSKRYRNQLMAKFGDEVANLGYTPTKRGAKGEQIDDLGDLGDLI